MYRLHSVENLNTKTFLHRNSDFEYNRHHPFTTVGKRIPPVGFKIAGHIISVGGKNIQRFQYPNKNPA